MTVPDAPGPAPPSPGLAAWGVAVGGLPLRALALGEALAWVLDAGTATAVESFHSVNVDTLALATQDREVRRLLLAGDLLVPDSWVLVHLLRLCGLGGPPPLSGHRLCVEALPSLAESGTPIAFCGGRPGVAETARQRLVHRWPTLQVVGAIDGYIPRRDAARQLAACGATVVFLGLPTPMKEQLALDLKDGPGAVRRIVGSGGSLDILAGRTDEAPDFVSKVGLEWAFRLVQEPKRLGPRYARDLGFLPALVHRLLEARRLERRRHPTAPGP